MAQDRVDIAAQRRAGLAAEERKKQRMLRDVADITWLMGHSQGRRIMYGLLAAAGVYQGSFTGNSETFYKEGKRAIGLQYLAIVNEHCAEEFVLMLKEHKEDSDGDRNRN